MVRFLLSETMYHYIPLNNIQYDLRNHSHYKPLMFLNNQAFLLSTERHQKSMIISFRGFYSPRVLSKRNDVLLLVCEFVRSLSIK